VKDFLKDSDPAAVAVAALWISKNQQSPLITFTPEGREFDRPIDVKLKPNMKPADLRYTLDGSEPTAKSPKAKGSIRLDHSITLKARLFVNGQPMGHVATANYRKAGETASLLKPLTSVTTLEQVMPLVPQGSAARGRQLFLTPGGAGCFNCHRVGKEGTNFAPDLSGIGSRADAHHIVQSMLDPSAVITEGFNTHLVESRDGSWVGILLEESGLELTLGLMNGQRQRIPKDKITKHETLPTSAMPPFIATLSPQQCADVTAWLLEQKLPSDAASETAPPVNKKKKSNPTQPPTTP
jgi:putative heme-binding domain-containing protein